MPSTRASFGTKLLNRAIIALPIGPRRRVSYFRAHHRLLSLAKPVRYSEKVNWRMVFDRREFIAMACDKLAMKQFAADRIDAGRLRVPRTIWSGTDVRELAGLDLPARWVLKPNSGTGQVHFGEGAADLSVVGALATEWLADRGLARWGEWGYSVARRVLVLEERIEADAPGDLWDWKFFVFDGKPVLISLDTDRLGDHRRRLYTAQWEPLPVRSGLPLAAPVDAPPQLAEMLAVAAELGAGLDHIRVDLYLSGGRIWFGELTPYSGSGVVSFEPDDFDVTLGAAWTLPELSGGRASR